MPGSKRKTSSSKPRKKATSKTKQEDGPKEPRPYSSYIPPPTSNPAYPSLSLSESSVLLPDGRERSNRQRVFLIQADTRLKVPGTDSAKLLCNVPVPQVNLPAIQPLDECTILFTTTTVSGDIIFGYSLTDALSRRNLTSPNVPAFWEKKSQGKTEFVWHLSWPGYNTIRSITFSPKDSGIRTHGDLAFFLASHVKDFMIECTEGSLKGMCTDLNWAITEDKNFDDFGISSFWTPDNKTWRVTVTMKWDIADELLFCMEQAKEEVAREAKEKAAEMAEADEYEDYEY